MKKPPLHLIIILVLTGLCLISTYLYIDRIAPDKLYNVERQVVYEHQEKVEYGVVRENETTIKKKLSKFEFYILFRDFRKHRKAPKKSIFDKRLYYLNDDFIVDYEYLKSYFKSILYSYYKSRSMQQLPGATEGVMYLEDSREIVSTLSIPNHRNRFKIINEDLQFFLESSFENDQIFYREFNEVLAEYEGIINKKFEFKIPDKVNWNSSLPKVKLQMSEANTGNYATAIIPHGRKNLGSITFYKTFFNLKDADLKKGIIRHELGHILGFSHENKILLEDKSIINCKNAKKDDFGRNLINICLDTSSFMMTECIINSSRTIKPKNLYQFSHLDSLILDSLFNNPKFKTNEINIFKSFYCN